MAPIVSSRFAGLALLPLALLTACRPEIPRSARGGSGSGESVEAVTLHTDPPAPLDALPPIVRFRLSGPEGALDPERLVLVRGEVGKGQLRQIARGEISKTLSKRVVPAITWRDEGSEVVLAPTVALEPGVRYALAGGSPPAVIEVRVVDEDPTPTLARVWPPPGQSASARFGVFCGDVPLPALDAAAALAPGGVHGRFCRGVIDGDPGLSCLRFEPSPESGEGLSGDTDPSMSAGSVPPPFVIASGVEIRLDPRPLVADAPPAPPPELPCAPDEIPFGPGCVTVADDRLVGRAPDAPLLWTVHGGGIERVFVTAAGDPFTVAPLSPQSAVAFDVTTLDNRGKALRQTFTATTRAPMPHVVLNEVLANPIGPEPAQEWVEIVNDGAAPADLDGYVLVDVGGETPLPPVVLPPGAFALVVNEAYAADDDYDPGPAPGVVILRVPKLGKGGLANGGEPLKLRDGGGSVISRFPANPKPKPGKSVARRRVDASDALAGSFALAEPSPGRDNGL